MAHNGALCSRELLHLTRISMNLDLPKVEAHWKLNMFLQKKSAKMWARCRSIVRPRPPERRVPGLPMLLKIRRSWHPWHVYGAGDDRILPSNPRLAIPLYLTYIQLSKTIVACSLVVSDSFSVGAPVILPSVS